MLFVQQLELTDPRPARILRLVGNGMAARDAAAKTGISRKTVERWRQRVSGFGDAYNLAVTLSRDISPNGREALDRLVQTWAPGGLAEPVDPADPPPVELRQAEPSPAREPVSPIEPLSEPEQPRTERPACVDPDVLDAHGKEITTHVARRGEASPYTTARPPTRDEWLAEMAKLGLDKSQPERVRAVAIAAVSSGLNGGPVRVRGPAELEEVVAAAARGRDPGVPASVWQEARKSFLGPAPVAESEDESGDVVEFERAPPG